MQKSQPFARSLLMAAAISSIVASTMGSAVARQSQLASLGPYVSRGKGEGKGNRSAKGAGMANIRAAHKARNVRKHRATTR